MPKKLEIGFKFMNTDQSNDDEVCIPRLSSILLAVSSLKMMTFCQRSGVGGQKKTKTCQRSL